MSFSSKTKEEICKVKLENEKDKLAQLYGMLMFSRKVQKEKVLFSTSIEDVLNLFIYLLNCVTGINKEKLIITNDKKYFNVSLKDEKDNINITSKLNCNDELKINYEIINNNIRLFLCGAFLSCGTITNPEKGYHLEFYFNLEENADLIFNLISKIKEFNIEPRVIKRKDSYIVYIKESESISDFLTYIGAMLAAMDIMQAKMLKEVRNYVNRTTNFETANINKTAMASVVQLQAIENIIKKEGSLNNLPDDLREIANLRKENPEMSLRELGTLLTSPISRSGVNHRLKRIIEISKLTDD